MKLQTRFLLDLGLLAVVAIVTFTLVLRQGIGDLQQQETESALANHMALSQSFITDVLDNLVSDLDLISQDSITRRYFSTEEITRYQLFHTELTRTLKRYLIHRDSYAEIAIILPDSFKEVYVANHSFPTNDYDNNLNNLLSKPFDPDTPVRFMIEQVETNYFTLVAYTPIVRLSSLLKSDVNPTLGYLKISIELTSLARKISSPLILMSINHNDEHIFDPKIADALGIDDPMSDDLSLISEKRNVHDIFELQGIVKKTTLVDESKNLFVNSIVWILISIISLLFLTFILLKLVILKPLATFTSLIEQSDISTSAGRKLTAYKDNEFGRLMQRFDDLMQRLHGSSRELQRQAFTDTLTGLPNRAALYHLLEKQCQEYPEQPYAVLFIDLDGFKQINDNYGHDIGDQLLIEVSKRLSSVVRGDVQEEIDHLNIRQDAVIRLGGDEFTVVLLGDCNAALIAQRIIHAFRSSIIIEGKSFYTGTSIGIANYPRDANSPALLIQYADLAMYNAKATGKMRYCAFTQQLAAQEKQRLIIEDTVREGIEFNRFEAHFQAKVDSRTDTIVGVEALARLRDKNGKLISPGQFIPAAQANGVLEYITYVVTEHTCKLLQQLNEPDFVASVNISPSQLNDLRLIADIRSIMWRYGIQPRQIEFEITEEELVTNFREVSKNLELLRKFGFRTALDDFGSGYSSLGQLKKFRFDTLKLDRDFVSSEDYNSTAAIGVISSIKSLAETLDMAIVAEGVETQNQLEFVQSAGIYTIQGYYCSKPLPFTNFIELFQQQKSFDTQKSLPGL